MWSQVWLRIHSLCNVWYKNEVMKICDFLHDFKSKERPFISSKKTWWGMKWDLPLPFDKTELSMQVIVLFWFIFIHSQIFFFKWRTYDICIHGHTCNCMVFCTCVYSRRRHQFLFTPEGFRIELLCNGVVSRQCRVQPKRIQSDKKSCMLLIIQ